MTGIGSGKTAVMRAEGPEDRDAIAAVVAAAFGSPAEAAQLLRLTSYDPSIQGRVAYPPAFDGVIEH